MVNVPAKQRLYAVPCGPVDDWFMLTGIPLTTKFQLTNVRTIF